MRTQLKFLNSNQDMAAAGTNPPNPKPQTQIRNPKPEILNPNPSTHCFSEWQLGNRAHIKHTQHAFWKVAPSLAVGPSAISCHLRFMGSCKYGLGFRV